MCMAAARRYLRELRDECAADTPSGRSAQRLVSQPGPGPVRRLRVVLLLPTLQTVAALGTAVWAVCIYLS